MLVLHLASGGGGIVPTHLALVHLAHTLPLGRVWPLGNCIYVFVAVHLELVDAFLGIEECKAEEMVHHLYRHCVMALAPLLLCAVPTDCCCFEVDGLCDSVLC